MITFDRPQLLIGCAGLIPVALFEAVHYARCRGGLFFFLERTTSIKELTQRYLVSSLFFGLFLGCSIIALAAPRWGRRLVTEYRRGVDIVFALDLSRSMDVQDAAGKTGQPVSRLNRAVQIALETTRLGAQGHGIRFGAAIGKGQGVLAVPLTYDSETVAGFLEGVSTEAITGWGTNLETLLTAGGGAFLDAFPAQRGIILLSDGEAWSGSLSPVLDRLTEKGITVIAVGVGTETGGPVPGAGADDAPISSRRGEVLRNIAERTGGRYVDGNEPAAPAAVADQVRGFSETLETKGYHLEMQPRWRLFGIAALVSLGLSKTFSKRRRYGR